MSYSYSYSHRHEDGEDREVAQDEEEEDGIKPYTAVGAMLDSATRFKRRMNYGRAPAKQTSENKAGRRKTPPRYMKPTEASTSRKAVPTLPGTQDLRRKYPHWYGDKDSSPAGDENDFNRFSERIDNERNSPSPERNSMSPSRKFSNNRQFSPEETYARASPSSERNPSGKYSYFNREESPEEENARQTPPSPSRGQIPSSWNNYNFERRDSTGSYQTVKIRRSDLEEIRARYSLRYKDREPIPEKVEEAEEKSNIYKYSSNMRNERPKSAEKPRSSSAGSSIIVRDSYGRSSTPTADKSRSRGRKSKREEWKVEYNYKVCGV